MKSIMKMLVLTGVLATAALVATGCMSNYKNPKPNQMLVIRGDEVKNTKIQEILCPNDGATDVGIDTQARPYHAAESRRYYNITTEEGKGDRPGADSVKVDLADGVKVGVEMVFSFHTNFTCDKEGKELLKKFDEQFGNRPFPVVGEGDGTDHGVTTKVWQGGARGWDAFLDLEVRQKGIDPVVKDVMEPYTCNELSTLCAAMKRSNDGGHAVATEEEGRTVAKTKEEIEEQLLDDLNAQLKRSMGDDYLTFTEVDINSVNLPKEMQDSVQAAQTAYTDLAQERAAIEREKLAAQAEQKKSSQFTRDQLHEQKLWAILANCKGCRIYVDPPSGSITVESTEE